MGLEIPEEFWPITPIRTIPLSKPKTITTPITPVDGVDIDHATVSDLVAEIKNVPASTKETEQEDDASCHTPKSESQMLKTPLQCPPAPRKPRPAKRKSAGVPTQLFFHVPRDLSSVFAPLANSSKKIKASG